MKLWLSKNSPVPLREQLTRQIILAIVSGDLRAGDRLPSIREIALRHKIHPNTASAAYRWLEQNGWVSLRVGSGVYVREISRMKIDETNRLIQNDLDKAVCAFLDEARNLGAENGQIKSRLNFWLNKKTPQKLVIVERDENLARIFAHELSGKFTLPVSIASEINNNIPKNALVVSLSEEVREFAPAAFVKIKLNSVQQSLSVENKPALADLIGVASHWETFLRWSQTILAAVGIAEENLVVRDANEKEWQKGLSACRFVIADSLTAGKLNKIKDVRVFRLLSEESLAELRKSLS